ncbi:MAG TPA: hypothetical protein DCL38_06850, partial [Lachnospiraceae bacterium]|nr:hypothetical protein [Lachnospiraceae bacterium]
KREDAVPSIMVTLAPKEFEGRFYVSALHGMWVLMPSVVGGAVDTVRFVFENEFVNCFEAEEGMNEGVDFFGSAAG